MSWKLFFATLGLLSAVLFFVLFIPSSAAAQSPPTVFTDPATSSTSSGATLNGEVDSTVSVEVWFRYGTVASGFPLTCTTTMTAGTATTPTSLSAGTGQPFSRSITGLAAGTEHRFCAFAENTAGTVVGSVLSFPTAAGGGGFVEEVPTRFGPIPEGPQTGSEFISTVEGITNWVFVILLVFAVVFILLAAFQFLSGGGDPQAVAQARQKLIWAAVGIVVALLARGIPTAISNLFL